MAEEFTHQRIYRETQLKLQEIAKVYRPKVTVPALLEALTDTEWTKHPELTASEPSVHEAPRRAAVADFAAGLKELAMYPPGQNVACVPVTLIDEALEEQTK